MGFAILNAAAKSVQSVTEFVEQRLGVVERKQRRLAVARLGEVHDIDDERTDIALELFPVAQPGHPGAAVLRRAGKIIAEEKSAMTSGGVPHLHTRTSSCQTRTSSRRPNALFETLNLAMASRLVAGSTASHASSTTLTCFSARQTRG